MNEVLGPVGYLSSQAYIKDFDSWARKKNRNYSRRAFAKWASIPSSNFLTLIISGQRPFQLGWVNGFSKAAKLNELERSYLNNLISLEHSKNSEESQRLQESLRKSIFTGKITNLKQKELYLISSPEVWAIYIALNKETRDDDQARVVKDLVCLDMSVVRETIKNFKKLELVEEDHTGRLIPKYKYISTENEYSRLENQKFHEAVLKESHQKLQELKATQRSYGSLTILLSDEEIVELKKEIQDFGKSLLSKYGEVSNAKDKRLLARLNIQFYPLTKENK